MDLGRTLEEWLQNLDLERYKQCFHSAGITELSHCQHLDDAFLNDIGITPLGHRKRILEHLPKISNESRNDASQNDMYINYPPQDDRNSIYANYPLESTPPIPPKVLPPNQGIAIIQPSVRKKPIPKPRKSKAVQIQSKDTQQSTASLQLKHEDILLKQNSLKLSGATVEESNTDFLKDSSDHTHAFKYSENIDQSKHSVDSDCAISAKPQNVPVFAQNDFFFLQQEHYNSKNVNEKSDPLKNFGNFEENQPFNNDTEGLYEPIWMSANENKTTNENDRISNLKPTTSTGKNKTSDSSPLDFSFQTPSPAAPPACKTHFPFEGNTPDLSFGSVFSDLDSSNSAVFSKSDAIYENTEYDEDDKNVLQMDSGIPGNSRMTCLPPPVITCKPKGINAKTQSSVFNDSDIHDNTFELPPPEFPPPPLPQNQCLPIPDQLDFREFDPLAKPSLPPVPPRPAGDTGPPTGYVNVSGTRARKDSDIYSLADSPGMIENDMISALPTKHNDNVSLIYSLADASECSPVSGSSTLSPVSDPFHGEDPFNDASFAEECTNFNIQQDTYQNSDDNFDPFGLNKERGGSKSSSKDGGSLLGEIPPAPNWYEADELPHSSLYSMASPSSNFDVSTEESSEEFFEEVPSTVQILPPSTSPKKNERAGYLYKQGGIKGNKGWRKRWVVFTGKSLRYYANSRSQVSKRIVPVSCMKKVDSNVREGDKDKFKFNLVTQNRVFQFAAETLDDFTHWSSTLMQAILQYKPPPGGEREGGEMNDPEKQGVIRFERQREKRFVAIKQGKLCYYHSLQDFKQASPIHEIEMKLASVKDIGDRKLQLSTHYAHFVMLFDTNHECLLWKMAIEESIADGLGDDRILNEVRENPSNKVCADCDAPDPHWASVNLGIVLCKKCAGIHRNFEHRISKVKSLRMDTKIWTPSLIELLKVIGNENSKRFWEKQMPSSKKITEESSPAERKDHIEAKYKRREYCDKHEFSENNKLLNEMLLQLSASDDLLQLMQVLFSGANIYYTNSDNETSFQIAKRMGQRLQMEFLFQNGGDRSSMIGDTDETQAAKLRAEVCLEGYLMKTGSNMKDFLKRWCVLEHGCLRYFIGEKSSVAKDSIDNESMMCVQSMSLKSLYYLKVPVKRNPEAFELSTTKERNRVYLFAASSPEERNTWMRALAKLFCPIPMMDEIGHMDFTLAGNFYVKTGHSTEWEKTWLMINKKVVLFTDKEMKLTEQIDLRKAKNIQYQESISGCTFCTENGKCLALDIPGRALYFQADLSRDTERLQHALAKEMTSGNRLDDQQLTANDTPVIVDTCIRFIEDYGLKEEGVYRHAGVKSKVQFLLDRFQADAHSVVLKQGTHLIHEVACCLKQFFRDLEEPLLMHSNYEQWLKNAEKHVEKQVKLDWYQYLLHQLPKINFITIQKLISHLIKLSTYEEENKMGKGNIALVFGPSLLRDKGEIPNGRNTHLQIQVIGDLMTYHNELFEVESGAEDVDRKINEAREKIERLQRDPRQSAVIESLKIPVYFLDPRAHSELQEITRTTTVKQAEDNMRRRMNVMNENYTLHEILCDGHIERPLHPSDLLFDVTMAWSQWEEVYRKSVTLCLKPSNHLKDKLVEAFDPCKPLFAELKYIEKKNKVNKHGFEFKQSKLSYYKDLRTANVSSPTGSWKIEDVVVYHGIDPTAMRRSANKIGLSFMKKGDRPGSKEMPFFGRALCFSSEDELLSWMSAMMFAQHPEGLNV